ncbi:TMEM175 family protein [Methanobrevibacter oralis]|uniref:TMEM175 family protein n=1 Tax=Methanobrevibacter oralis TaxID=66851 RepID=UPI001C73CD0A|nr:TMEM175 family protein [Methanobrevibacter oralis]
MGLTDGIFGMVMTLLVFGMALPESIIVNYTGFISFVYSLIPTIGIVIVAFVLISSFWVYHHEFIKVKSLNIPYLWLNIFYLASISFIPFTTSIIGLYSHFFLAEVIFGINIMLTIILFLIMFHYADKRNFLANNPSKEEKKYIYDTFFIIVALTFCVNLLDFNVSKNFIYLFLLVPVISTIRDINFKIKS